MKRIFFAVVVALFLSTIIRAENKHPTVLDYFLAVMPLDEGGNPRDPQKFLVKDIPNGYLKDDSYEVALFYKKDRTPIIVTSNQNSDSPDLTAYQLRGGKWEDRTKELFPTEINTVEYIVKRFQAKGIPFTVEIYQRFAEKPIGAALPRKGKTIVFSGAGNTSGEQGNDVILFKLVFEDDQFKLKE